MEQTLVYKISTVDNKMLFDSIIHNYTGLFQKLYNNMELSEDKGFISEMQEKFHLDKTIYDFCLSDVKMQLSSVEEINNQKRSDLSEIENQLNDLDKKKKLTKADKYNKKSLLRRRTRILRALKRDVCFGGKNKLREITNLKQKEARTKRQEKKLKKLKKEFTQARKRNIFLWGRACEGGNRKADINLIDGFITLKINKDTKIKINIVPMRGKIRSQIAKRLDELIRANAIAITIRVSETHVHITFDNEYINNFAFDTPGFNEAVKENDNPHKTKKEIRREFHREQRNRKLEGRIENRCCAIDPNPEEIGFSIVDVNPETHEVERIIFQKMFDLRAYTKKVGLTSKQMAKINRKYRQEIIDIVKYIFRECDHYKVSHFGLEDSREMSKKIQNKGREFNRLTKNMWQRDLLDTAIKVQCGMRGIICYDDINPYLSSFIGNIKNKSYDCIAASIELGRRTGCKFKKGASPFPILAKEDRERMFHLFGQDVADAKNWASSYRLAKSGDANFFGGWWRNKIPPENLKLMNKASNVYIC